MNTPGLSNQRLVSDPGSLNALKFSAGQEGDKGKAALKETAKQFEALFMRELIKSMREATMKSGLLEGEGGNLGNDLLDQQFAVQLSGMPGGLSGAIERQLSRQMNAAQAKAGATPDGKAAAADPSTGTPGTGEAMEFYVQLLRQQVQLSTARHQLPVPQLDQHLARIIAIDLGPQAGQRASLQQLLQVEPVARLPAYAPLLQQIHAGPATDQGEAAPGVSQVAQVTSEKLQAQFASRGVAGAVAAAVGRVAGALISVGVAGVRALVQNNEREDLQAQTRRDLGVAFDQAWLKQLHDPEHGVMAGVYYLARQIEAQLQASQPLVEQGPGWSP